MERNEGTAQRVVNRVTDAFITSPPHLMAENVMDRRIILLLLLLALSLSFTSALRAHTGDPPASAQAGDRPAASASNGAPDDFTVYLPLIRVPPTLVSAILAPFDANVSDLVGPTSWEANYGKRPEIIAAAQGTTLHILAQDYDPHTPWTAVLVRLEPADGSYRVTQALTSLPMLDRILGLAIDDDGNRYYATCVDESHLVNAYYPPLYPLYRSNIVRVVKVSPTGDVLFNVDLDVARGPVYRSASIINPMYASTARLVIAGRHIGLVHGGASDPDWTIGGQRHQWSTFTRLDAISGEVTWPSGLYVSHSFDQRLMADGTQIIELYLGDAFPRAVTLGRDGRGREGSTRGADVFAIKGPFGENLTATRLGNVALIDHDPAYRYLVLFATERSDQVGNIIDRRISGPRNLAIVRVHGVDLSVDSALPDTLTVVSNGITVTNRLRWLTSYSAESRLHAERPKLIGVGDDRYIVLWEEWRNIDQTTDVFNGVYGMLIDAQGAPLLPATLLTTSHLPRGDDAIFFQNGAAWVTGDAAQRKLYLHMVDARLQYQVVTID